MHEETDYSCAKHEVKRVSSRFVVENMSECEQQTTHTRQQRTRSLPAEEARGFSTDLANELSSDDDLLSDSDATIVDGEGNRDGDQCQGATKRPSFFTPGALIAASAQDAAERQAKQQQTQNYEAVMRKFQVRKVSLRSAVAFSSRSPSSGTLRRSLSIPPQLPPRDQGLHEADAMERAAADDSPTVVDASPVVGNVSHSFARRSVEHISPSLSVNGSGDGARRSKTREVHPHSFPDPPRSVRFTLYRFFVKKKRRMLRRMRRIRDDLSAVIYPTSAVQRVREGVLFSSFVVQLVCLPLLPVYFPSHSKLILALQIAAEWIYCVDCALGFNTAFFRKTTRELVTTRREIARHYFYGWFGLDALSSLPVNTVVFFASGGKGLLEVSPVAYLLFDNVARIPRFVSFLRTIRALREAARALRAGHNFWTWALLYSRYSHLLRIARLVCVVVLIEHYMACLWQFLSSSTPAAALESPLELYVQNFYNVVLLVNGQSVATESVAQTVYSIVAVFVGSFILAIMFGNVAMLVANFNASATSYQRNLEKVFGTMNKMQLPAALQERVRQYFTHLWQEYDAVDADLVQFPRELTPTLALEVGLCKYMNLITGVPYWRECSPDFVSHVIRSLVVRVYLPDDFVLRRRAINQDLYMINRGTCELVHPPSESDAAVASPRSDASARLSSRRGLTSAMPSEHARARQYKSDNPKFNLSAREKEAGDASPDSPELLRPGQVFGGMGLLVNFEHQSNVRAVTHVEMCVLSRQAFQKLLMRFQLDRPVVLAALLKDAILKDELPFSIEHVFGISVVVEPSVDSEDEEYGGAGIKTRDSTAASPCPQMTPSQAADFLMRKINHEVRDPTIMFGFQQVSSSLTDLDPDDAAPAMESVSDTQPDDPPPPASNSTTSLLPSALVTELPPANTHRGSLRSISSEQSTNLQPDPLQQPEAPTILSSRDHQSSKLAITDDRLLQLQEELQHMMQRIGTIEASQAAVLDTLSILHQAVARITKNVVAMKSAAAAAATPNAALGHQRQMHCRQEDRTIPEGNDSIELAEEPSARQTPSNSGEGSTPSGGASPSGIRVTSPLSFRLRASRAMTGLAPIQQRVLPESDENTAGGAARLPARRRATMAPRRNAIVGGSAKKHELLADSLWMQYSVPKL